MALREEEKVTIQVGGAVLANKAILALNEYDKWPRENRNCLLEVYENNIARFYKFGRPFEYRAETSIFVTCNPEDDNWRYEDFIERSELPFTNPELSRFDMILVFRDQNTLESDEKYIGPKVDSFKNAQELKIENALKATKYSKLIEYAKSFKPGLTDASASILKQEWVRLREKYRDNKKDYPIFKKDPDVIHRFAQAYARLHFRNDINEECMRKAVAKFERLREPFNETNMKVENPTMLAYDLTMDRIKRNGIGPKTAIELVELIVSISNRNQSISRHIGPILTLNNSKLRRIYDKVLENKKEIGRLNNSKETKVYWLGSKNERDVVVKSVVAAKKDIPQKIKKRPVFPRSKKTHEGKKGPKN